MRILDNRALFIQDYGFDISGAGPFRVQRNQAREIGGDTGEYGVYLSNTSNALVTNNVATRVLGYGYYFMNVNGSTIRANRVDGAFYAGFHIYETGGTADGNVLADNVARNCLQSGFIIDPNVSGTTLDGNRALLTNFKYCDQGTGTTLVGNNFTTSQCPP